MATEKRLIIPSELIAEIEILYQKHYVRSYDKTVHDIFNAIRRRIRKCATVDAVEVVHGRWRQKILVGGFAEEWGYVCSECGCTVSDRSNLGIGRYASKNQRLNYCPNCGANMMDGDGNV